MRVFNATELHLKMVKMAENDKDPRGFISMWHLRSKTNEQAKKKEKKPDLTTEQTDGYQGEVDG